MRENLKTGSADLVMLQRAEVTGHCNRVLARAPAHLHRHTRTRSGRGGTQHPTGSAMCRRRACQ